MSTRQARRQNASVPTDGSRTITVHDSQPVEDDRPVEAPPVGALRLRGVARHRQRVVWREDVVDNEGAGKKKSKSECSPNHPYIHPPRSSSGASIGLRLCDCSFLTIADSMLYLPQTAAV